MERIFPLVGEVSGCLGRLSHLHESQESITNRGLGHNPSKEVLVHTRHEGVIP